MPIDEFDLPDTSVNEVLVLDLANGTFVADQRNAVLMEPVSAASPRHRAGTMTRECKLHGTTMLLAALNVLDGPVITQNIQRHRSQEFNRFLNRIEREVPSERQSI